MTGTDGAGWTADESLALRHFLAALETRPVVVMKGSRKEYYQGG